MGRRKHAWLTAAFLTVAALSAGGALSAPAEIDEDFMRTVEDTTNALSDDLATGNAKAAHEAGELATLFAKVEAYYADKGDAPDALKLSKKSRELSGEIAKLVGARDFDGASAAATDIQRACKTCHNFYKKS